MFLGWRGVQGRLHLVKHGLQLSQGFFGLLDVDFGEETRLNTSEVCQNRAVRLHGAKSQCVKVHGLHHESCEYDLGKRKNVEGIGQTMNANVLVPVLLFVLLTPRLLLALPSGQPLWVQTLTHAAVFGVVYAVLRTMFPQYY